MNVDLSKPVIGYALFITAVKWAIVLYVAYLIVTDPMGFAHNVGAFAKNILLGWEKTS